MDYIKEKLNELKKSLSPKEYSLLEQMILNSPRIKEEIELKKFLDEMNIQIGDYIEIITPHKPVNEPRMDELIGYKGVVVDKQEKSYFYHFVIWFEDEEARKIHGKYGGIYFNPYYIKKLEPKPEVYQAYLEEKKKLEYEKKYQWGVCGKCKGPLEMYYHAWCPNCEKPDWIEDEEEGKALVFMKVITYAETHLNIDIYDKLIDYLLEKHKRLPNDDFFIMSLIDDTAEEDIKKVLSFIKHEWDIKESHVKMWISY